jgi:hypothetical protein
VSKRRKQTQTPPEFIPLDQFIEAFFRGFGFTTKPQPAPIVHSGIPENMFRKLLMLCHPDKHNNSPLATEVTQWLLEQRKERT